MTAGPPAAVVVDVDHVVEVDVVHERKQPRS
jgi:hypothetical protein